MPAISEITSDELLVSELENLLSFETKNSVMALPKPVELYCINPETKSNFACSLRDF